jgi:hypothetical protein
VPARPRFLLLLLAVTGWLVIYLHVFGAINPNIVGQRSGVRAELRRILYAGQVKIFEIGEDNQSCIHVANGVVFRLIDRFGRRSHPVFITRPIGRNNIKAFSYFAWLEDIVVDAVKCTDTNLKETFRSQVYGRRSSIIFVENIALDRRFGDGIWEFCREALNIEKPNIRSLVLPELIFGGLIGHFSSSGTSISRVDSVLHLMSGSYHLPPLANGDTAVENDRKQSKPFNQEPYPVASFCTCIVAAALVFGGLCLMQYSDHFLWGGSLVVSGLCMFVYGLDGIFDFMEIATK